MIQNNNAIRLTPFAIAALCFIATIASVSPAPADFEGDREALRERLAAVDNIAAEVSRGLEQLGSFTEADRTQAAKWFDQIRFQYQPLQGLLNEGKGDDFRKQWNATNERWQQVSLFQALVERRRKQLEQAPTEESILQLRHETPPVLMPLMEELIRARQLASEAWGRAASACVPDNPQQAIERAGDEATRAQTEAEIIGTRCSWAHNNLELLLKPTLSPELKSKVDALKTAEDEEVNLLIEQSRIVQKIREADQKRIQTNQEARLEYAVALKAAEQAVPKP